MSETLQVNLEIQKKVQLINKCLNRRIESAINLVEKLESLQAEPELEEVLEILDHESMLASNFLQDYTLFKGTPLVFMLCADASEMEFVGENITDRDDVQGVAIVTPCNSQKVKELIEAFNRIMGGKSLG